MVQNEPADLEHNIYDKLKRFAMFATVQTENRQPLHYQPCTHSEEYAPEANMGWVLAKARSGSSQFSEKVKDYLTKRFDIGEKTGQKVSTEQVAKDMRYARTHVTKGFLEGKTGLQNCKSKDSFLAWHLREEGRVGAGLTRAKRVTKVTKLESNAMLLKK